MSGHLTNEKIPNFRNLQITVSFHNLYLDKFERLIGDDKNANINNLLFLSFWFLQIPIII